MTRLPGSNGSIVARMLLILALLLAQQIGIMHAFGHVRSHGATHEHTKGVPTAACDECVAFAQIQPAPGLALLQTFGVSPEFSMPSGASCAPPRRAEPSPFHPRAPPICV